jgi:hypothetical protein
MTAEAGMITGELELHTERADSGEVTTKVRYAGADEWYLLRGVSVTLHDERDVDALHDALAGVLGSLA